MFFHLLYIAIATVHELLPNLELLNKKLKKKVTEFTESTKIGRTHLQDAQYPWSGVFGYQSQLKDSMK